MASLDDIQLEDVPKELNEDGECINKNKLQNEGKEDTDIVIIPTSHRPRQKSRENTIDLARQRSHTPKNSVLSEIQHLETWDWVRITVTGAVVWTSFTLIFLLWSKSGISALLPTCAGVSVKCECEALSWASVKMVFRLFIFILIPVETCVLIPYFYFNGSDWTMICMQTFIGWLGWWSCMFIPDQHIGMISGAGVVFSVIFINIALYWHYGWLEVKNFATITFWFSWLGLVTGSETCMPIIHSDYYPYAIPILIAALECLWIQSDRFVKSDASLQSTAFVWGYVMGVLAGMRFNMYMTMQNWNQILISVSLDICIEILFKVYPSWRLSTDPEGLSPGEALYCKIVPYSEYIPVLVYFSIWVTGYSPFSQLSETTIHGCAGTTLVDEFYDRYIGVAALVAGEIISDTSSVMIAGHFFNVADLVKPLKLDTTIEYLIFWGSTFTGCFMSMELCATVFKSTVRGGIV